MMRLIFHDCIPYLDENDGTSCDGCLNFKGMNASTPFPNGPDKLTHYRWAPPNATDNKGLDLVVEQLEIIYTKLHWPLINTNLDVSLYQSGKSRSDLWQLAGLVTLEETIERANRACDLDFNRRQQVIVISSK